MSTQTIIDKFKPYQGDAYSLSILASTATFIIASPCIGLKWATLGTVISASGVTAYNYFFEDKVIPKIVSDTKDFVEDYIYEPISNLVHSYSNSGSDNSEL